MKYLIITAAASFCAFNSSVLYADSFVSEGIRYEITGQATCSVVSLEDNVNPSESITIPETVSFNDVDYRITSINEGIFQNLTGIKKLIIKAPILSIPAYLCAGCKDLAEVEIPETVVVINEGAFTGCENLQILSSGNDTESLPNLNKIDDKAFFRATSLQIMPKMPLLEIIGESSFRSCRSLRNISFASSVITIGKYSFNDCENIEEVSFTSPIMTVGEGAFDGCLSLVKAKLEFSDCVIHSNTFRNCSKLNQLITESPIERIGESAFENCHSLTNLPISENTLEIGKFAFSGCNMIENLILRILDTKIAEGAFRNCKSLKFVSIWGNVSTIERNSFSGCESLEEVEICPSVDKIEADSFSGCTKISSVHCDRFIPPFLQGNAFENETYSYAKLFVVRGFEETFRQTPEWDKFLNIYGADNFPTHASIKEITDDDGPFIKVEGKELQIIKEQPEGVIIYDINGIKIGEMSGNLNEKFYIEKSGYVIVRTSKRAFLYLIN